MNDETDEVLIRSALCWLSAGFLHFVSPLHPPPAGQQATSQGALLRGLFNNVEGERRETKWERKRFSRRCGSPLCDIYLRRGPECVCACLMALCQANDTPLCHTHSRQNSPDSDATRVLSNPTNDARSEKSGPIIAGGDCKAFKTRCSRPTRRRGGGRSHHPV